VSELADVLARLARRDLILFGPALPLSTLLSRRTQHGTPPFPLGAPRTLLTYSGTSALSRAAAWLGLEPGDAVLCPSYNCGHELEPLRRAGLKLSFYRVDGRMDVDLDDVERRLHPPIQTLLVTHYFGFPQPVEKLRRLCDERGVRLIEDCAHALQSRIAGGPLGSFGDVAIFSLRKSLPLPDGGAVVANRTAFAGASDPTPPHPCATLGKTLDLWQKHMMRPRAAPGFWAARAALALATPALATRRALRALELPSALAWYDPDDERFDFDERLLAWTLSDISRRLLVRLDYGEILRRRRANYAQLCQELGELASALLRPELPEGVSPLFFPVRVDDPDSVTLELYGRGITLGTWWDAFHPGVPWDEFPDAVELKRRVVALPVHQDLEPEHVARMARALLDVLAKPATRS
jgi:perosamine synthetase